MEMRMSERFTLVESGRTTEVDASIDDERVWIAPVSIEQALGWALQPEGFCRDGVCVPVRDGSAVLAGGAVDLAAFGDLIDRPMALDLEERVAAIGASARDRGAALASLDAPNFTLPGLDGRRYSLSDFRGQKVFLAVWASW
jgi:hypothetical protein